MEEQETKSKKKKRKLKVIRIFLTIVLLISIGALIYSGIHIFNWHNDKRKTEKLVADIEDDTPIEEVQDDADVQIVEPKEEEKKNKNNPYWDYIKMNLINVDFSNLKEKNADTAGWIQVNGTNINYPFVQARDNEYYLTHSFDKSYNSAGWVFLDYRNNINNLDKNTILYAHARLDKTMFGTLQDILKNNWYANDDNHIIKLSTEKQNTLWQVFSVYSIPTTSDYIQTQFTSDQEFETFAKKLQKRSIYKFNTTLNSSDKLLTLSTCLGKTKRMVVHAKLIKYSDR